MNEGRATFVRQLEGWTGDARLFRLAPPLRDDREWSVDEAEFIIVSATLAPDSGPETYIFAADADGKPRSMNEMPGSFQGALDHAAALRVAGYEIEEG